jgi:excisionase family DNA binding protein
MPSDTERRTYDVDEAAEILGIGRGQCYAAVRRGQIASIKIGKRVLIPRTAIDRLLGGGAA